MSTLAPLRHAPFRFMLAGRTVNALGNAFAPVALAFAVLDLTGSARDLGLVVGIRSLFNVVFLLFGGVLADRLPKNLLMVWSSVAAAITQGLVAALVLTGSATIPLLMALGAVNGLVAALALPASAAILPRTVPASVLQQANVLNRLGFNGAAIVGATLAGIVVAAVGPGWGIAVDAATFAISAACFAFLRLPSAPAAAEDRPHLLTDLRTGWAEFRSRTWLWVVVAGFCVVNMAWSGGLLVLGPVVADATIGRSGWGLVLSAETVGLLLGALVALRLRLRRLLFFGVFSCMFMALPVFLLGVYPQFWALVVGAFVMGLMLEQFGVAWDMSMQEHIPPDKLARVYSYDMLGSFLAIPLGQIAIGPLAEAIGTRNALLVATALIVLATFGMLSSRDVRTLPHKSPEPAPELVKESHP